MKKFRYAALFALMMLPGLALQTQAAELPVRSSEVACPPSALAGVSPRRLITAAEVWNRTELYFGSSKPDGSMVTEAEFAQFVDCEITPRFPDGLTLLTGYGQFRNTAGTIVREKSFVLILFYPPQTIDAGKKIQEIRENYKKMFSQESVLRVDSYSIISF